MLSLSNGIKIAVFEKDKDDKTEEKYIYIKDDDRKAKPEIQTTQAKREELFDEFIRRDAKLALKDIKALNDKYKKGVDLPSKLERKYEDATTFVDNSLKYYLDYPKNVKLHPLITQPTYRMFISGLSGSGKSTYIANFLKYNKPKHIFLMSPIMDDEAFKKLKPTPVHLNLETYEKEYEHGPFDIEHLPPDSVLILDDIDTGKNSKQYQQVKVQILERGRHLKVSTIVVSHNPLGGNVKHAVAQLLESEFYVIFPKANRAHAEKLLKKYVGIDQQKCNLILDTDSRAVLIKKSYPSYFVAEHTVGCLN